VLCSTQKSLTPPCPQIEALPYGGMSQCLQLRTLLLARAGMRMWPLPPAEGCLSNLKELVLANNRGLAVVPHGAFASCAGSLVTLDLSGGCVHVCLHDKLRG